MQFNGLSEDTCNYCSLSAKSPWWNSTSCVNQTMGFHQSILIFKKKKTHSGKYHLFKKMNIFRELSSIVICRKVLAFDIFLKSKRILDP